MPKDTRIVYGVSGTWWDSIDKAARRGNLPCCPHCGSMLLEMDNIDQWWRGVDKYNETHPGYRDMMEWARGKCFPNMAALERAYNDRG